MEREPSPLMGFLIDAAETQRFHQIPTYFWFLLKSNPRG